MADFDHSIGFIGAGNMGSAFIGALAQSGLLAPANIMAADVDEDRIDQLENDYGITGMRDNRVLFQRSDVVFLAVKPQQMPTVLAELTAARGSRIQQRKLVISIAAGFPIRRIEEALYKGLDEQSVRNLPIIRVMPNTPALVLSAISGMSANRFATAQDEQATATLLKAVGEVLAFEEEKLDAVTALSGSGPAYVFYLIECLTEAGVQVGLDAADAAVLATHTLKGAVALLEVSGESPKSLRRKVTSPGGTTEAAMAVFKRKDFKATIIEAVMAATRRARELAE